MDHRAAVRDAFVFSGVTIGLSYLVFWGPVAILRIPTISFVSSVRGPLWAILLFMAGAFVPSVVAIVLTGIREGRPGVAALLKRAIQLRLGLRWYAAAVVVVLLGTAGQLAINALLGHSFDFSLFVSQLPSFIPLIILGPISEELGWRGYLLQKLQLKLNPLVSSVLVGLAWALWHLPLFLMVGTSQHELGLPFPGFLVGLVALSMIMTWLNNNTSGSIWAAIFFHWLYTYGGQVVATGVTRSTVYSWIEYAPYVLLALLILVVWKPAPSTMKG